MMLLTLTLLLMSCASIPSNSGVVPNPYVEGVSVVEYDVDTGKVSMPLWYWKKLVRYIVDTQ